MFGGDWGTPAFMAASSDSSPPLAWRRGEPLPASVKLERFALTGRNAKHGESGDFFAGTLR